MEKVKIEMDATTKAWFENKPAWMVTTVTKCEKCGLYYKPDLGHKCKGEQNERRTENVR